MRINRILLIALLSSLLVSCSSLKTYPNNLAKNIFVTTITDSGSILQSIKTRMDVHAVNERCELNFLGAVSLNKKNTSVGLTENKLSYLDFVFVSSGFFSSSSSVIRFSTLFRPRKSYVYDFSVSYANGIYGVDILEKRTRRSKGREIEIRMLSEC